LPVSPAELDAYTRLIHALCEMAKKQTRVTMKERAIGGEDSEKFAFRTFLLRLGFIGTEYASARKVLLAKLSGSGSFKNGDHKDRFTHKGSETVGNGSIGANSAFTAAVVDVVDAISVGAVNEETASVQSITEQSPPSHCQDCRHHCYCTDSILRTSTGGIVDTSRRTPDNYTHYCLGVPSGYRKIKHAVDWSGIENPPKWCPLIIHEDISVGEAGHVYESGSAIETAETLETAAVFGREASV